MWRVRNGAQLENRGDESPSPRTAEPSSHVSSFGPRIFQSVSVFYLSPFLLLAFSFSCSPLQPLLLGLIGLKKIIRRNISQPDDNYQFFHSFIMEPTPFLTHNVVSSPLESISNRRKEEKSVLPSVCEETV